MHFGTIPIIARVSVPIFAKAKISRRLAERIQRPVYGLPCGDAYRLGGGEGLRRHWSLGGAMV